MQIEKIAAEVASLARLNPEKLSWKKYRIVILTYFYDWLKI
jgi:hypothetical protein